MRRLIEFIGRFDSSKLNISSKPDAPAGTTLTWPRASELLLDTRDERQVSGHQHVDEAALTFS